MPYETEIITRDGSHVEVQVAVGPEAVAEMRGEIDRLAPTAEAAKLAHAALTAVLAEHSGEWAARQDKCSLRSAMSEWARRGR